MANIPISQIPNAPTVQAQGMEQALPEGDNTYRQIRTSIAEGGAELHQNLGQLAAPGEALQHFGTDVTHFGNDMGDALSKVTAMDKAAGATILYDNYTKAKQGLQTQMANAKPEEMAGIQKAFNESYPTTVLAGMSPLQKALMAPDIARLQTKDMIEVGVRAHVASNADLIAKNEEGIQTAISSGDYTTAAALNHQMTAAGLRSEDRAAQISLSIDGAQQVSSIKQQINTSPQMMIDKLSAAQDAGTGLSGYGAVSPKQIPDLLGTAKYVLNYQQQGNMAGVSALIDNPKTKPQTLQQLEAMPQFQKLTDEQKTAATASFTNQNIYGTQTSTKTISDAQDAVNAYNPARDESGQKFNKLTTQIVGTVPATDRTALLQKLTDLHSGMIDHVKQGGALSDDSQNIPRQVTSMIASQYQSKIHGEGLTPAEASQGLLDKTNMIDAFNRAWADPAQKGNGTMQDALSIYQKLSGSLQRQDFHDKVDTKSPSNTDLFKSWGVGQPPDQTSINNGSPLGKVTSYGYQGDTSPDSLTKAGKSAIGNLGPDSLAVSRDVEQKMADSGIKIGDKVNLHLADGSTVTRTWDDRTAKSYKGKPETGRFDFYSPGGIHPQDGVAVTGFSKVGNS